MKERFRLPIKLDPQNYKININDSILALGSCFVDSIGKHLLKNKFDIEINPFGTLFNPFSIYYILQNSIDNNYKTEDYIYKEGLYYSLNFHSNINSNSKDGLERKIQKIYNQIYKRLKSNKILIITYGTAIVYKKRKTNKIVGNCHKLPSNEFIKEILTVDYIVNLFTKLFEKIKKINSEIKIILTVSPVRHIKDNLSYNMLSKSILRITCNKLTNEFISYFPSYEILIDDLRDYRFYKEDMIHPNEIAERYILELFKKNYFDAKTNLFIESWRKIEKNINHNPFNPNAEQYKNLLKVSLKTLETLENDYSIDFNNEKKMINKKLK